MILAFVMTLLCGISARLRQLCQWLTGLEGPTLTWLVHSSTDAMHLTFWAVLIRISLRPEPKEGLLNIILPKEG